MKSAPVPFGGRASAAAQSARSYSFPWSGLGRAWSTESSSPCALAGRVTSSGDRLTSLVPDDFRRGRSARVRGKLTSRDDSARYVATGRLGVGTSSPRREIRRRLQLQLVVALLHTFGVSRLCVGAVVRGVVRHVAAQHDHSLLVGFV